MLQLESFNPSTAELLDTVDCTPKEEISKKVEKAHEAKSLSRKMSVADRVEILQKVYDDIAQLKETLSADIATEVGIPISQTPDEVDGALSCFEWYLQNAGRILDSKILEQDLGAGDQISEIHYTPRGVTAVFPPWNYPLSDFMGRVLPNLFAGNPVVIKASPECPLLMKTIEAIFKKHLGENGLFDMVYGGAKEGEMLIDQNIDFICFSGSPNVGSIVQKKAGEKGIPIISELGGAARAIVYEGSTMDSIKELVEFNRLSYNGQICDGLTVMLVQRSILDEVRDLLLSLFNNAKMGNAMDEDTIIGPLSSNAQIQALNEQVTDAQKNGGNLLVGGKMREMNSGYFYPATLIELPEQREILKKLRVYMEDVFGPVLSFLPFTSSDDAIQKFNDPNFGLGGYILTRKDTQSIAEARKVIPKLDTGMVGINNACYVDPSLPFGGIKKSGMGRIGGEESLKNHCEVKVVVYPH